MEAPLSLISHREMAISLTIQDFPAVQNTNTLLISWSCWRVPSDQGPTFLISSGMRRLPRSACNCTCAAIAIFPRQPQTLLIVIWLCSGINLLHESAAWGSTAGSGKRGIILKFDNTSHAKTRYSFNMVPSSKSLASLSTGDLCPTNGH